MPTHNDETLLERYQREALVDERIARSAPTLAIRIKRELFRFASKQHWVNKAQSWYAECGVRKGHYITVDAAGHVIHMGKCFDHAAYPVTCYELQTNWPEHQSAQRLPADDTEGAAC